MACNPETTRHCSADTGVGKNSPGDNFDGENFVTPPILVQGHQTPEGKFSLGAAHVSLTPNLSDNDHSLTSKHD